LHVFDESIPIQDLMTKNVKLDKIGQIIEGQALKTPTSTRAYHALTRGWILNEIFRRVEPEGRTIGQFVNQELSPKLDGGVTLGGDDLPQNLQELNGPKMYKVLLGSLTPKFISQKVEVSLGPMISISAHFSLVAF